MSEQPEKATLLQVIQSVLGAMLGVQKSSVAKRDFSQSSPWAYVIVGIIMTILFILTLVSIVSWVLQ